MLEQDGLDVTPELYYKSKIEVDRDCLNQMDLISHQNSITTPKLNRNRFLEPDGLDVTPELYYNSKIEVERDCLNQMDLMPHQTSIATPKLK